jgi:hypothetical protein
VTRRKLILSMAAALAASVLVFPAFLPAQEEPLKLECDSPVTITLPLSQSDPTWPKAGWRFLCNPRSVKITLVRLAVKGSRGRWVSASFKPQATVVEEGAFELPLATVCAGETRAPGRLVGGLKWAGLHIALRDCTVRQYDGIELDLQVNQ